MYLRQGNDMHNRITDEMTRNVYGCEGLSHDQILDQWQKWCLKLVSVQRADGCEVYGDMVDCFWNYFEDGYTPQEAWDDEKTYASGDIDETIR